MASLNKQNIISVRASRGLRVQQPFRSPLRVPGTSNSESKDSQNVTRSPAFQSNNRTTSLLQDVSLSSGQCSREETRKNEESNSAKDIQERIGSVSTTPKRPLVNRCSRVSSTLHRKVSPRQFSVPFRSPVSNVSAAQQSVSKEDELNQLLKYESELDEEITTLRDLGFKEEELQGHIENLHQYNETKDSAQLVMGRLAELDGVTVKDMHEKYGVPVLD